MKKFLMSLTLVLAFSSKSTFTDVGFKYYILNANFNDYQTIKAIFKGNEYFARGVSTPLRSNGQLTVFLEFWNPISIIIFKNLMPQNVDYFGSNRDEYEILMNNPDLARLLITSIFGQ